MPICLYEAASSLISAELYEIRFSTSRSTITTSFEEAELVAPSMLTSGTLQPAEAGAKVSLTLRIALTYESLFGHVYFGMRAMNQNGTWSEESNVAELFVE